MGLEIFISLVIFYLFKLYRSLWQFASINELKNILSAAVIDSIANVFLFEIADKSLPLSCYFIYFLLITMFLGITRLIYRMTRLYRTEKGSDNYKERRSLEKVMIIGAGMAGEKVLNEIFNSQYVYKEVVCFIDDDLSKYKLTVHGIPIAGNRNKIIEMAKKYKIDEILVAIPSADKRN